MRKKGPFRVRWKGWKRTTQWVVSTQCYGQSGFNVVAAGAFSAVLTASLLDTTTAPTALGDPILDRFTVLRIVGDLLFETSVQPTADLSFQMHYGIYVAQVNAGGTVEVYNPQLAGDADASWVVVRHAMIGQFANSNTVGSASVAGMAQFSLGGKDGQSFFHLDIHQKRVLRPNERLILAMVGSAGGTALPAAGTMTIIPYLRTLVAKAI